MLSSWVVELRSCTCFSSFREQQLQVGVIEGGYDRTNDPLIDVPNAANALGYQGAVFGNSTYDWKYTSVPQRGLGDRVLSYPRCVLRRYHPFIH